MPFVKNETGLPIPAAIKFLLSLLRYHDNSENPYSDCYYLSDLIFSMGRILQLDDPQFFLIDDIHQKNRSIVFFQESLEEIRFWLSEELETPSFRQIVAHSCLEVLFTLQCLNQLEVDIEMFLEFSQAHYQPLVRKVLNANLAL